mmetsp:Transcript_24733/g.69237  ORF Transcript_24733/g.69237 Transcript_24733/m.69237 type:complete len:319 (-) Transcript_24733:270-1226(-)
MLLLPGIAFMSALTTAPPTGRTMMLPASTRSMSASSTWTAVFFTSCPMLLSRTTRLRWFSFFLSTFIFSMRSATKRSQGNSVGSPTVFNIFLSLVTSEGWRCPRPRASSTSFTIPTATHSPCSVQGGGSSPSPRRVHRSTMMDSTAWPSVCPKFSKERTPLSRSSCVTTSALIRTLSRMQRVRKEVVGKLGVTASFSTTVIMSALCVAKTLMHSDSPLMMCRFGNVLRNDTLMYTLLGAQYAPIRFFPWGVFSPVFPPTLASTIPSSVVGIWTKAIPRRKVEATKPDRSPTTPPPSAISTVSLPQPAASIVSSMVSLT